MQAGIVKVEQLYRCGLTRSGVTRWTATGHLYRLHPAVYAVGHMALTEKSYLIAALFHACHGSALSHGTAAYWWQLAKDPPAEIHVSVPRRKRAAHGIAWHRPRSIPRVLHHRLPVTPVARTLLDFAATASLNQVRKALAEAEYRGLLRLPQVEAVIGRGRPRSATLHAALDLHLPSLARTESPLEDAFVLLCERHGIPPPIANAWIGGRRVDALWSRERVVVELDSRAAHGSDARRLTDHQRDLELRTLGHVVRRYSWHQVFFGPAAVAADLKATLASAAH